MEKTEYGSMNYILFQTTPNDDMSRYSFIFSNPDPLETEVNNMAWFRLITIL